MIKKQGPGRPAISWPTDKVEKLKALYPGTPTDQVAIALKTTVSAVKNAAKYYGVKKEDKWSLLQEITLLKVWGTLSAAQIAKAMNKTRWSVINKHRELTKPKK